MVTNIKTKFILPEDALKMQSELESSENKEKSSESENKPKRKKGIIETKGCWKKDGFVSFKDSEPHYYEFLKAPVFATNNELIGFILIFQNADEKKEMADSKENFIAPVTHDLKSPTYAQINILDMFMNDGGNAGFLLFKERCI